MEQFGWQKLDASEFSYVSHYRFDVKWIYINKWVYSPI